MGLDAFVRCRCWEDGTYDTPPPVPADRIAVVDGYLTALFDDDNEAVDTWRETACAHPNMEAADEWISNFAGVTLLRHALRQAGSEFFPALTEHLPGDNAGELSAPVAARVLAELADFEAMADVGLETVLLDEDTGAVLTTYDGTVSGAYFSDGRRADVAPDGFQVLVADQIVFRSTRFRYEDGMLVDGDQRVPWPVGHGLPPRMRVETRPATPVAFKGIVGRLRTVCQASVETGNPVVWC